mgnify:CR=1 FL=1
MTLAPPILDPRLSVDQIAQQLEACLASWPATPPLERIEVNALFISDLHLGLEVNARAAVLAMLQSYQPKALFLVGDILDGWVLKRRWFWDQTCQDILARVLDLAKQGCCIKLVSGNHDDYLGPLDGFVSQEADVSISRQNQHVTATDIKCLIVHGDQFDPFIGDLAWASHLGARVHRRLQGKGNRRKAAGDTAPRRGVAWAAKRSTKTLVNTVVQGDRKAAMSARPAGASTLIMGHTHHAKDRQFKEIRYLNTGDWVESCTAVVETLDGCLTLTRWDAERSRLVKLKGGEDLP